MLQKTSLISFLFLVLLTGVLYSFGLHGPFLLDDQQNLSIAQVPSFNWHELWQAMWANDSGPLRRPISVLSFILSYEWLGGAPFDYKIVNLGLHLLCGLLLLWTTRLVFAGLLNRSTKEVQWYALGVTAFWLLHPLQVSTVLYAVQRMAILSTLFMFLALSLYLTLRLKAPNRPKALIAGIILAWLCAIFSKENGILFPFYVTSFELVYYVSRRHAAKKWLLGWAVFCSIIVIGAAAFYLKKWPVFSLKFAEKGFTLPQYLAQQSQVLVFYLKLMVIPKLSNMGLYHEDFLIKHTTPVWVCISLLSALLASALLSMKRFPVIALGLLWFLVSHGVESTVLPLEPVFEHRNYFALGGMMITLFGLIEALFRRFQPAKAWSALPLLWLLALVPMTVARVDSWSTPEKFLITAKEYHPQSARTHIEWANYLFVHHQFDQGIDELHQAQVLDPNNSGPIVHELVTLCFVQGPKQALLNKTQAALAKERITPYTILTLDALVQNIFNQQCQYLKADEVVGLFDKALENPYIAQRPRYLSNLYHLQAGLMVVDHHWEAAIKALDLSYKLNPEIIKPLLEKTQLLIQQKDTPRALESLQLIEQTPQGKRPSIQQQVKAMRAQISGGSE